jgi:hypothetical protein
MFGLKQGISSKHLICSGRVSVYSMGVNMNKRFPASTKLFLAPVLLATMVLFFPSATVQTSGPWYVSPNGNDNHNCLSPATACATINGAIAKAGSGGIIHVRAGTYTGGGDAVVSIGKHITLSGGWNAAFDAQNSTSIIDGNDQRRGITISSGVNAAIDRFVVQNGFAVTGGGIFNSGTLTLQNSFVINNSACCVSASNEGGGIYNNGTLTLNNCTVDGNWSDSGGGGIFSSGTANITGSRISHNQASGSTGGGLINGSIMSLNDSAVINNLATSGGGIWNRNVGTLVINNSTISGNRASNTGAAIWTHGTLTVSSSTVSNNHLYSIGGSGGIYTSGTTAIQNSIVAGNSGLYFFGEEAPDCSGSIDSWGYNLIGDTSGCTFNSSTGDLLDVTPNLFPVAIHSGYHPLLPGSPAIDAGNPDGCTDDQGNLLTTDQRGKARPLDGNNDGMAVCDIGAYEFDPENPTAQSFLPVTVHNYCTDFFDDFSNPASGWYVGDDNFVRTEYLNGEFRVLSKQAGYFYLYRAPTCARQNYTVAVDARWVGTPGESYGIMFGLTPNFEEYYLFEVNTDYRMYRLLRRDAHGFDTVIHPIFSEAINGGTGSNRLQVTLEKIYYNNITLSVNGVPLTTVQTTTPVGPTSVGVMSSPYDNLPVSDARFDNFSAVMLQTNTASNVQGQTVPIVIEYAVSDPIYYDMVPTSIEWRP